MEFHPHLYNYKTNLFDPTFTKFEVSMYKITHNRLK